MQSLQPGTVIAGKYRIERLLGEGGMGTVFLATHLQLGESVALKVPLPQALGNRDAVARFMREGRAAVRIKSEHVARVIDVGELAPGEPYMVMEYLEGNDLATWLSQHGRLPVKQAVEFVLQACEALAEAHALGIVHRDLKPGNLFCVRRPDGLLAVKVLDFGISKALQRRSGADTLDESITRAGDLIGSPLYMSPEQIVSARAVDARTDIWAIGVILFELLCDRAPFHAESVIALGIEIAHSRPASLRTHRPDAPERLERVISRCLEKDRERRYPNVSELALALMEFAPKRARASVERVSRVIHAAGVSLAPGVPAEASRPSSGSLRPFGSTSSTFGHSAKLSKSRTQPILLTAAGALLVGTLATFWFSARPLRPVAEQPLKSGAAPVMSPPHTTAVAPRVIAAPSAAWIGVRAPSSARPITAPPRRPSDVTRKPRRAAPSSEPSAAPSAPPATDCFPKFYYDSRGTKHFKPECL